MRLWREARFEDNMSKTAPQPQTLESGGVQNCTRLWRQTHVEVSTERAPHVRTSSDLAVEMSKEYMPLRHEAHFEGNKHVRDNFGR